MYTHGVGTSVRGLSLIETIFSLAVLGLIAIVVLDLFPASMLASRHNEQKMQAEMLAESLLATEAARPFDRLVIGPAQPVPPSTVDGVEYRPELEVRQVEDKNVDYLKSVIVRVRWDFRNNRRMVERELWVANVAR